MRNISIFGCLRVLLGFSSGGGEVKAGQSYYTINSLRIWWTDYKCIETKEWRKFKVRELVSRWVFGNCPVFDKLAFERCRIYTKRSDALKIAKENLARLQKEYEE